MPNELGGLVFIPAAVLALIALWVPASAFAQLPPTERELQRLVAAYRVDKAVALIAKDAIYEASLQDGLHKSYYACVNGLLRSENFTSVAVQIAGEVFSDANTLNFVSGFFEGNTGQKMTELILRNLADRPIRRVNHQAYFQPGDYLFTQNEKADIQQFEASVAYSSFQRLRRAINDVGMHPGMRPIMSSIQASCSFPTASKSQLEDLSYAQRIRAAILPYIVLAEPVDGNPTAQVKVTTRPDGGVVEAELVESSGYPSWDESVRIAVLKASRIPLDTDGRVPPVLIISFRPKQ